MGSAQMPLPRLPTVGLAWRASQPSIAALMKHLGEKKINIWRGQKTFSQKRTIYLCKKSIFVKSKGTSIVANKCNYKGFLPKKIKRQNLFAEKVPTFSPRMRTPSKLPLFAIAAAILASPVMCIWNIDVCCLSKNRRAEYNFQENLLQSSFHWCCCFHQSSLFPGVKG